MNRRLFIQNLTAGAASVLLYQRVSATTAPDLPNVLLLGDSISIGYTPFVKEILEGRAHVFRPVLADGNPENCSGTTNGVKHIDRWLGDSRWDVIHFNFGLHDIKHVDPVTGKDSGNAGDPLQAELKQYMANLKYIVGRLQLTGAKLIFATTTPVPEGKVSPLREPENVVKYNLAAVKWLKRKKIAVNDLYAFAMPILTEIQRPQNVHFTDSGSETLGKEVASQILRYL